MHLEILTDVERHINICKEYWQLSDQGVFAFHVREIADKYGMNVYSVSNLVNKDAFVWFDGVCCERCLTPYHFTSRNQYLIRLRYINTICTNCSEAKRRALNDKKANVIERLRREGKKTQPEISRLTLQSKIYLTSVIQAFGSENLNQLSPLDGYPTYTLSPDKRYDQIIVQYLFDERVILVSSNSSLKAIDLKGDDQFTLHLSKCKFELPFPTEEIVKLMNNFRSEEHLLRFKQSPAFYELCLEVQTQECLAFLKYALTEHQLNFSPGKKTHLVIRECLKYFSVSQIYNLIWRAVKDSIAYYMRCSIGKYQAANSVVGNISKNMERALANGWEISPFRRNYKMPQSSISRLLFNTILGTDDGGFDYPLYQLLDR
ncbi:TPA: hypothetical protein GRI54_18885 [Vibrio parahaemolyticus]|nr:hypothetical protein [Vibrio parahaemolyticus]HAS6550371.1 hypothetical protein [Vibrio parahaemolyticus]HAS6735501.1 hypothetical protein [Vibrio parahaemolyticus]HAS6846140.1 hypothetical protein [Vibrio parahaemolyticus]